MTRLHGRIAGVIAALALVLVSACQPIVRNHGFVPRDEELAKINVGVDTRESVAETIGVPGAGGVIDGGAYYYVRSRWETWAWQAPKEAERQVVAITFDKNGKVSNVGRYGLDHGRVVVLSSRVTATSIHNVSFIRQLLGNLGRFRAENLAAQQ